MSKRISAFVAASIALVSIAASCGSSSSAEPDQTGSVTVEVLSLDHAPIRPVVDEVTALVDEFGDDATLSSYNFDTPDGDAFAEEMGIEDHTPVVIFVNGESSFDTGERSGEFSSFPAGEDGGIVPDGNWTIDDLRTVIDQLVTESSGG